MEWVEMASRRRQGFEGGKGGISAEAPQGRQEQMLRPGGRACLLSSGSTEPEWAV